jgi:argininosuccinate lyase
MAEGLRADQISLELVNRAAREVIGKDLVMTAEELRLALDPVHFVKIRNLPGGPNADEIKRMITQRTSSLQADAAWLAQEKQGREQMWRELDQRIADWSVG